MRIERKGNSRGLPFLLRVVKLKQVCFTLYKIFVLFDKITGSHNTEMGVFCFLDGRVLFLRWAYLIE
jgi:hypothetical protein